MTLEEAEEKIHIGKTYQHYKGRVYTVDCIATDVETSRLMVLYHKVKNENTDYFVIPVDMWLENINVPRFKLLEEE